ncbi:hypothetical protein, partial [Mesorhizobium sp. M1E.F.Ca.ET.041.01.1.1]|uniref:hypothetical protein n=1 Tax=Mesorhizobium sp. M1E.F.Ca.ET.041.01.1.1 TaxID=2496759 RepID=UPI001AED0319
NPNCLLKYFCRKLMKTRWKMNACFHPNSRRLNCDPPPDHRPWNRRHRPPSCRILRVRPMPRATIFAGVAASVKCRQLIRVFLADTRSRRIYQVVECAYVDSISVF